MADPTEKQEDPGSLLNDDFVRDEHPGKRPFEPGDPMQMHVDATKGDPELMLTSLIEEYAMMGLGAENIMRLFEQPFFRATHNLLELFGAEGIRPRVDNVLRRCGVFQVTTEIVTDE